MPPAFPSGRRALGPDETRGILRIAAVQPSMRHRAVMDILYKKAKLHTDPVAQAFGIKLEHEPKMMEVRAGGGRGGQRRKGLEVQLVPRRMLHVAHDRCSTDGAVSTVY